MPTPILSILVITHNQRDLLKRCLQSVLAQELHVPFEVIVSDDRSSDGTEEWITAYQKEIISRQQNGELPNLVELRYVHCNSDECDPKNVSERCGWNKLTAWRYAQGKYMVNVDADDYLRSTDIYQMQIDALETHPECSMCQQGTWQINNGETLKHGIAYPCHKLFKNGAILTIEDTLFNHIRTINQSYMMRRYPADDMEQLYGKWYDDTVITYHHYQYGPVVCINRFDYVWVQYATSISNQQRVDNAIIMPLLSIQHAILLPKYAVLFLQSGIHGLFKLYKSFLRNQGNIQNIETKAYFEQFNGRAFHYATKSKYSAIDYWWLLNTLAWIMFLCVSKTKKDWLYNILYHMLV